MRKHYTFLFRPRHWESGSKIMRCDQLAEFVKEHSKSVNVEVMPLIPPQRRPGHWRKTLRRARKGAIIVLKGATEVLDDEQIGELRDASRVFAIDHLDLQVKRIAAPRADVHIACSAESQVRWQAAIEDFQKRRGVEVDTKVVLVDHHADPGLKPLPASRRKTMRVIYMGKEQNVELPGKVAKRVELHSADTEEEFNKAVASIKSAQVHYGVRPVPKSKMAKPFTKGFTAAAMDRAILTTPDTEDAVRFLGEDYPLFAKSRSEEDILEALDRGSSAIGTPAWNGIMDRMRAMREAVRPETVARQLTDALEPYIV